MTASEWVQYLHYAFHRALELIFAGAYFAVVCLIAGTYALLAWMGGADLREERPGK